MNDVMNEHNVSIINATWKHKQLRALEHSIMGQFLRIIRQGLLIGQLHVVEWKVICFQMVQFSEVRVILGPRKPVLVLVQFIE